MTQPLDGVRVLDLTRAMTGPSLGRVLLRTKGAVDVLLPLCTKVLTAEGVVAHTLTAWNPANDQFSINREPAAREALSQQTGITGQQQHDELEERAAYLTSLVDEGVTDFDEVRGRILDWS